MKIDCNNHVATFNRIEAINDEYSPLRDKALGLESGNYSFIFKYPLSVEVGFPHQLTPLSSVIDILLLARADYERIYKEEDAAVGPTKNIPGMLNRASSNGPYGIWGHDISDLYFEGVNINKKKKIVDFSMGS